MTDGKHTNIYIHITYTKINGKFGLWCTFHIQISVQFLLFP